ncbi:hypothetical protein T06_12855 [Trichinella sp. T6]|nr:hypothetical protein T06_12855 [Trichinella sp. T6]
MQCKFVIAIAIQSHSKFYCSRFKRQLTILKTESGIVHDEVTKCNNAKILRFITKDSVLTMRVLHYFGNKKASNLIR